MKALNSQDIQASEQNSRTITVLGGGPAGLAVGYYANKNGFRFKIYEASADVGGMCRTLHYKDFAFDMGAHRLQALVRNQDLATLKGLKP
jgi:protoporphyrinogen oxidase